MTQEELEFLRWVYEMGMIHSKLSLANEKLEEYSKYAPNDSNIEVAKIIIEDCLSNIQL